jgi:hypothetical protein
VAEKQAPEHFAGARDDRDGKIASDRRMALGHPSMRAGLAIARVQRDVVGPHHALAPKGRVEHGGHARHPQALERRARNSRERVKPVAVAVLVDGVVKERTELRAGQLGRGLGDGLHQPVQVEFGREQRSHPVQCFERSCFFGERLLRALAVSDVLGHSDRVERLAGCIAHHRRGHAHPQRSAVFKLTALLESVGVDLAGPLTAVQLEVALDVARIGDVGEAPDKQFLPRVSGERAECVVDPKEAPAPVGLGNSDRC